MLNAEMQSYILNLPIAPLMSAAQPQDAMPLNPIDVDNLPNMVVAGSNLIQFSADAGPALRTSLALTLLAAQRVATEDTVTNTPDQWIERHHTVLTSLGWQGGTPRTVNFEFRKIDEAVNQAIIPFLSDAFNGSGDGGQLILNALSGVQDAAKHSPWFALFDRSGQHLQVTEYQFSAVAIAGDRVNLRLASARFEASFGRTQVLFIKVSKQQASFEGAMQDFSAQTANVTDMRDTLKVKLAGFAKAFIRDLSV